VCTADLEDELIRAAGHAAAGQIIQAHGELRSLRAFQQQPAQQRRSPGEQLHRFMGTRSGRKRQYARLLASALDLNRLPGHLTACSPTPDQFSNSDAPPTQDRDS
jgi:hypothetical protein